MLLVVVEETTGVPGQIRRSDRHVAERLDHEGVEDRLE